MGYERQKSKDVDRSSHSKVNTIPKVVEKALQNCNGHFGCGDINGCFVCDMGEVWILSCLSFGLDRTIVYSINNDLNLFRDFY